MRNKTSVSIGLSLGLIAAVCSTARADLDTARKFKAEGDGLVQRGKASEAIGSYERAIAEAPDWLVAYDALAASLFAAGRAEDVIKRLKPVVARHPDYAAGLFSLGYAYRKTGQFAESIDAYQKFLKLRKDDAEAYYGLGKAQLGMHMQGDAIASFTQYIRLEKRPSEKRWVEKAKEEVENLKKQGVKFIITKDPEHSPAERNAAAKAALLADEGDAAAAAGEWERAFQLYGKALALDGNSRRGYDGIGEAGLRGKHSQELISLFRNATSDDPGYASGYYYLGRALTSAGKKREALEALKRFASLQPTSPDGQLHLGLLLADVGERDAATATLKKYLEVENRKGAEAEQGRKRADAALRELAQ
jgi:tetratricopeptide (TPR) repeat protein